MSELHEAHRLIIHNMRVLEEAPAVVQEVTKVVFNLVSSVALFEVGGKPNSGGGLHVLGRLTRWVK